MKYILLLSFIVFSSCSSPPPVVQVIEATSTTTLASTLTPTITPISATQTILPTLMPTGAPIPCDPFTADYCITGGHFVLQRPIQPPANASVDGTYRYASTADGTRDPHHGVEMGKDFGVPVYAAAEGIVIFTGPDTAAVYSPWKNFYGNMVVLRHADELFTLYAHLSSVTVDAGDMVQVGEKIGEIGQSGAATGSHLHFEVRRGDVEDYFSTLNPELWLAPAQVDLGAISLAILDETAQFQQVEVTLQQYSTDKEIAATFYLDTYHRTLATGPENAALSDLPVGRYRVALIHNGHLYERWVDVQSGKLTQVVIVIK